MNWLYKIAQQVQYTSECTGFHNQQTDCRILAKVNERLVGFLTYTIFQGDYHIQHIEVHTDFQRQGIATDMYRQLEEEARQDGGEVVHTSTTDDGTSWRSSL